MKPGIELEHEELTDKIIGCAIEVHKKLGPGFLESIYENALIIELQKRNFKVELKAVKNIEDVHFAIVKSYLKALGKEHGLIINFSKKVVEVKRVIHK